MVRYVLFIGALAGCAGQSVDANTAPAPIDGEIAPIEWTVILDPTVPSWEAQEIDDAISDWEASVTCRRVTHVTIRAPAGDDGEPLHGPMTIAVKGATRTPGAALGGVGWGAWKPDGSRVLYEHLDSEMDRWDFPRLMRHEIGHAFDLVHLQGDEFLMSDSHRSARFITKGDVAAFEQRWCQLGLPTEP